MLLRLSGRKRCERVLRKGRTWKGKHFHVKWLPGVPQVPGKDLPPGIYIGIAASTKLDKSAVRRNRMRRRVREAFRMQSKSQKIDSIQLIARPYSSSLTCDFEEIRRDVSAFFSSLPRERTTETLPKKHS